MRVPRRLDFLTVHRIVVPAVLKLFSYAATDLEAKIGRYSYIARVEQAMNISAEEKTVLCLVRASVAVRTDVCSLKRRQSTFFRHHAAERVNDFETAEC
jgi:hypothetical protein